MLSKGIDCFAYLSGSQFKTVVSARGNQNIDIHFIPDQNTGLGNMQLHHCEIDKSSLNGLFGLGENTGKLQIDAFQGDSHCFSKYAEINPVTGNIGDSNLNDMLQTTSVIRENYAISYGFSDAGAGKSHQAYVYITDNYSNWMGDLINTIPQFSEKSFGTFVLPGSHDAGMFTGMITEESLQGIYDALGYVIPEFSMARRAITNFAYTQKDDINTQLQLGIRYFDFRPGYTISNTIDKNLYHQHLCIPGISFNRFLFDVVSFLKEHQHEVVVVNIKYDGFLREEMKPSESLVQEYISNALANSGIKEGGIEDLNRPIKDILLDNKRLIILKGSHDSRDSYNDNYKTDDVNKIIEALQSTFTQPEKSWTVLQLQSTYTSNLSGVKDAVMTFSDASSPLLATKAKFDHVTYNWLKDKNHVASVCGNNLVVLLNDFVDNALVSHAIAITKQRFTATIGR